MDKNCPYCYGVDVACSLCVVGPDNSEIFVVEALEPEDDSDEDMARE